MKFLWFKYWNKVFWGNALKLGKGRFLTDTKCKFCKAVWCCIPSDFPSGYTCKGCRGVR